MSMSDQYDDGRYDSAEAEDNSAYWDRRDSGFEASGGWSVPPDQAPEPRSRDYISPELAFVRANPITIQRGGIKYPARSYGKRTPKDQRVRSPKETHMAQERLTKAQIAHELKLNAELIKTLYKRRNDLKEQDRKALPAEPPASCTMFTVSVRFTMRGRRYQFLILRSGGKYFTTGGKPEHAQFDSWQALCEWLESDHVYDHSDIEVLKGAGQQVSFDTGTLVSEDTKQVPF